VKLSDDRRTVELPNGSATFDGQIRDMRRVGDTFIVLVDVPGGTASFMPGRVAPGSVPPPNAVVGLDADGTERWRHYGYDAIVDYRDGRTIEAKDEFWRWKLDARTGEVLDSQQAR
jgi:hypothetical protein